MENHQNILSDQGSPEWNNHIYCT